MVRLRELRDEFNLKIRSFEEYGFSRNIINNIELTSSKVDNDKLEVFCKIFNVSSDYFLGYSDEGIYVNYLGVIYSLSRDNFLKYKELSFIKYEKKTRLLVLPPDYDINTIHSNIKVIEVIKKN